MKQWTGKKVYEDEDAGEMVSGKGIFWLSMQAPNIVLQFRVAWAWEIIQRATGWLF